jgi:hypothetical protein
MMIDGQSKVIKNMTANLNEAKDTNKPIVGYVANTSYSFVVSPCKKATSMNFRQLHQRALDGKKVEHIYISKMHNRT